VAAEIKIMIKITSDIIDIQDVISSVSSEKAGAIDVFIGTVRNNSLAKNVVKLEYEAYDSMAIKKLEELIVEAKIHWPIEKASVAHRKGELHIGDVAVVVAVSTPHRAESFAACQWMIDNLKKVVPIWKKEYYEDGAVWVAAHA
jgi:molybdopterin synthase catalytic subunit